MCTERYLNPFTDYGFKHLFGSEANKENLINVLNALLDIEDPITDVTFLNTEVLGMSPSDREAIYDIYCATQSGSHVIVEMQNMYQRFFLDRSIYYSTFPMQNAAKKGEWDYNLPPVYTLAFLNFNMAQFEDSPEPRHVVRLCDMETKKEFYDKLTYIYVEMPKVIKSLDQLETNEDFWLYTIKNMNEMEEVPEELLRKGFDKFFHMAEIPNMTYQQRMAYEESLKRMRDYRNILKTAIEDAAAAAAAAAAATAHAEGVEEGVEIGREKERLEIAANLKKQGVSIEAICAATGLSSAQVAEVSAALCNGTGAANTNRPVSQ